MRIKEIEVEVYPKKFTFKLGGLFNLDNKEYRILQIVVLGESRVQLELELNTEFGCYEDSIYHIVHEYTEEWVREERWLSEIM